MQKCLFAMEIGILFGPALVRVVPIVLFEKGGWIAFDSIEGSF